MKEFNKLLIILLCTSLLLSIFVGCGSSNADSEPAHADSTASGPLYPDVPLLQTMDDRQSGTECPAHQNRL